MQPKQRDRPRKRGLNAIKVIAIALTLILSISSISVIAQTFTDKSSNKESNIINKEDYPSRNELIVMPEARTVIYQDTTPLSGRFRNPSQPCELIDNHFIVPYGQKYGQTEMFLTKSGYGHSFDMRDYTHIKVEFEIFNNLQTPAVDCFFYLLAGHVGSSNSVGKPTRIDVVPIEGTSQFKLTTRSGKQFVGEHFKIEYLIEVDKLNPWDSRCQTFIDGQLLESSNVFSTSASYTLSEVCFRQPYAKYKDTSSSLGVGNLVVTGCK